MADDETQEPAKAVTGRPNDIPIRKPEDAPLGGNSTFASRAKEARKSVSKAEEKQVESGSAENKAVASKSAAKK